MVRRGFWALLATVVVWMALGADSTRGETGWPEIRTRLLPDAAFAFVETDSRGIRHRHGPHHHANGDLDEAQLIFVLGTLDEVAWISDRSADTAEKHLRRHYEKFTAENAGRLDSGPVNLNTAHLQDLVCLPGIGPVLAVRIVRYREHHARFLTKEDVMKVDGISQGTFNAIRHYIEVD